MDSRLRLWSLSNTKSLNGNSPALSLSADVLNTIPYAVPPRSTQKIGDIPLATCLSDSSLQVNITPPLFGCWRLVLAPPPSGPFPNSEKQIESNDSRMQQVALANGKLWAALDTGLLMDGDPTPRAGVAFFTINPNSKKVSQQGYAGLAQNNLTYPAIAVTQSGRGVMAFTVVGDNFIPAQVTRGSMTKSVSVICTWLPRVRDRTMGSLDIIRSVHSRVVRAGVTMAQPLLTAIPSGSVRNTLTRPAHSPGGSLLVSGAETLVPSWRTGERGCR